MRRLTLAAALFLAGCATRPQAPVVEPSRPVEQPQVRTDVVGLTAGELIQRFGTPALQIREGAGLKLQFRSRSCVLDAYLYPPPSGSGPERVTHVDTRLHSGADTDQVGCIATLQGA
jgi:hypothetical protein